MRIGRRLDVLVVYSSSRVQADSLWYLKECLLPLRFPQRALSRREDRDVRSLFPRELLPVEVVLGESRQIGAESDGRSSLLVQDIDVIRRIDLGDSESGSAISGQGLFCVRPSHAEESVHLFPEGLGERLPFVNSLPTATSVSQLPTALRFRANQSQSNAFSAGDEKFRAQNLRVGHFRKCWFLARKERENCSALDRFRIRAYSGRVPSRLLGNGFAPLCRAAFILR
jgi:hypothetical protein